VLKPAKVYEKELNDKIAESMLDPKMKWWQGQYKEAAMTMDDSFWNNIQLVSVNKGNEVIGYFKAHIDRPENFINSIGIVNFIDKASMLFAMDIYKFFNYLVNVEKFPKLNWTVTIGNPVEKQYDKLCKKFGGRIVGTQRFEILIGNEYCDSKMYEWINDYHECTHCGHRVKQEQEVMCWECGLGEMIYHNPFRR